jgi:adenylate cyclase
MRAVYYQPDEREIQTDAPEPILNVSLKAGIPHTHVCGGKARCSTCRVMVVDGIEYCDPRNEKEQAMANRLRFDDQIRLACQTTFQGKISVRRLVLDDQDIELNDQTLPGREPSAVGTEKAIAIMFADIRNFTSFSEELPAYDVIHVLNRYFNLIGHVITENGGYIDKYIGDGIMALFGVRDADDAPLKAIKAGLGMLEMVEKFKPYVQRTYRRAFEIGIGVHYGEAVVGTIGAHNQQTETAIGDSVNFASRIESANKDAGTRFLISDDTYHRVKDHVQIGKTTRVMVKGKTGEHMLYEVVGLR